MKNLHLNWKLVLVFLLVTSGLLLLTESFFMSLGIVLLLFVAEHFVTLYIEKRKKRS